jgi:cation:H+ antiporter
MTFFWILAGLVFLTVGAEWLVRGAARFAASVGVSPLVVGLTVVAFGTSAPEMAVSVKAALDGNAGIAVGNVVGSNIFNVLFILGVSALIVPLAVSQQLIRFDVPLMVGVSALLWALGWDGLYHRVEGLFLLAGLALYTGFLIYESKKENAEVKSEFAQEFGKKEKTARDRLLDLVLVLGGLGLLVWGSRWLVKGAVTLALSFGVSDLVIGLTIIAAGTSLPEVVTSVVASIKGERDIAVGNVVGSNLFNILGVLGMSAVAAPAGVEVSAAVNSFDIPVMIAAAFACLPIFFTGGTISRWEGALLLGYYVLYTVYLILAATQHDALHAVGRTTLFFIVPLTALTLLVTTLQAWRKNRQTRP